MRYSFMTFSTPGLTFAEVLAVAKRHGYDGVEPRISAEHRHGIELDADHVSRQRARAQAEESGIALCCIATSCCFANPADNKAQVETGLRAIELAGDVGAPCIRIFGGPIGAGLSREAAIELVAESLAELADPAAACGVTVCMETHDDWCDPRHVAAVMQRVNHPSIAVN